MEFGFSLITDDRSGLAACFQALDTRIAYQNQSIETLNKTVVEQTRMIDYLGCGMTNMTECIEDAISGPSLVYRPHHPIDGAMRVGRRSAQSRA